MNKWQNEVVKSQFEDEKAVIKEITATYEQAKKDIDSRIAELLGRKDAEEIWVINQRKYQEALKKQVSGVLDNLHGNEFNTISDYLTKTYNEGFLGTMYDINKQGVPLIFPIDQEQVTQAIIKDTKLSESLYTTLGYNVQDLKKQVNSEISRGLANNYSFSQISRNIDNRTKIGQNKSIRVARTEGHRISQQATSDAQYKAKESGTDVLKQWDATIDKRTRKSHARLDGQIREIDEPFEGGAMYPGGFGKPGEDINCRCVSLQRAKWALDEDELKTLKERAKYFELDKTKDFDDFKEKYLKALTEIPDKKADIKVTKTPSKKIDAKSQKRKSAKPITQDEKDAIEYYASGNGMYINHYLRDGSKAISSMGEMSLEDKVLIANLEKATDRKHGYKTLYRSVDASAVFGDISESQWEALEKKLIYKFDDRSTENVNKMINSTVGKKITDKGFMSTTKDLGVALDFGSFTGAKHPIVIEFENAGAANGLELHKYLPRLDEIKEQSEILLHNNTQYEIVGIDVIDDENLGASIHVKAKILKERVIK